MRHVLDTLRSFGRNIFPSQAKLAGRCKMTKGTLVRIIDELKRDRLLIVEHRGPTSSLYLLTDGLQMAKAMAKPLAKAYLPGPITELNKSEEEQQAPPLPAPTVTTEYGRISRNPDYDRLSRVVDAARERLALARNPLALERHIIQCEYAKQPWVFPAKMASAANPGAPSASDGAETSVRIPPGSETLQREEYVYG